MVFFHIYREMVEVMKLEWLDSKLWSSVLSFITAARKMKEAVLNGILFWGWGSVLIACVVFSYPLSGPATDHQFSVEENETSYSGKMHHHHRRHTHSQDTLCHTHTKNSEYGPNSLCLWICDTSGLNALSCSVLHVGLEACFVKGPVHPNHKKKTFFHLTIE